MLHAFNCIIRGINFMAGVFNFVTHLINFMLCVFSFMACTESILAHVQLNSSFMDYLYAMCFKLQSVNSVEHLYFTYVMCALNCFVS